MVADFWGSWYISAQPTCKITLISIVCERYKCYFQREGSCNLSTSKVETYHMWIPWTLPKEDDISKQLVYDSMLTFKKICHICASFLSVTTILCYLALDSTPTHHNEFMLKKILKCGTNRFSNRRGCGILDVIKAHSRS